MSTSSNKQTETLYAAPGVEHISQAVRLRLHSSSAENKQSATVVCSREALIVHSDFFRELLHERELGEGEVDVVLGLHALESGVNLLQQIHANAFVEPAFVGLKWNADWAELAAHWQVTKLVDHFRQLISDTVSNHFRNIRAARSMFILTSGPSVQSAHDRLREEESSARGYMLVEMMGFASSRFGHPMYKMDVKDLVK